MVIANWAGESAGVLPPGTAELVMAAWARGMRFNLIVFIALFKSHTVNEFCGFENIESQCFTHDPNDHIGDSDDNEADSAVGHHGFGGFNFVFLSSGGNPGESADQEVEDKGDTRYDSQNHEDVGDQFFDGGGVGGFVCAWGRIVGSGSCDLIEVDVCHIRVFLVRLFLV